MLTCIACSKQLNTNGSLRQTPPEDDETAATPSTKQAIKALTAQVLIGLLLNFITYFSIKREKTTNLCNCWRYYWLIFVRKRCKGWKWQNETQTYRYEFIEDITILSFYTTVHLSEIQTLICWCTLCFLRGCFRSRTWRLRHPAHIRTASRVRAHRDRIVAGATWTPTPAQCRKGFTARIEGRAVQTPRRGFVERS